MITATVVSSTNELKQIIDLQRKNLKQHISEEEKNQQGFLTMEFSMALLSRHELGAEQLGGTIGDDLRACRWSARQDSVTACEPCDLDAFASVSVVSGLCIDPLAAVDVV